jgi:UrcA family protein
MSRTITSAIAALAIALAAAPAALAEGPSPASSIRVAYGDLDLNTAAHGRVLLRRIDSAARRACANVATLSPLTPRATADCRRETVADAVRGLNFETLTLAWAGRNPAVHLAAR